MRFKIGKEIDFKLYKKPKLIEYKYRKGFIVSIGIFRFLGSGGLHSNRKRKEGEIKISISKLYKLTETDKSFYESFCLGSNDFKYDWEYAVLSPLKDSTLYSWVLCDDNHHNDNWTININQLPRYYPWLQEEVLSISRLLNEVFDIEALRILEKILEYIAVTEEDNRNLKFEFSREDELTLLAEGIYKYKYKLGDLFYEKIPENSTPEIIGIAGDKSLVRDGFFERLSRVREQLKELFVHPYKVGEVEKYVDTTTGEEIKDSKPKGWFSSLIDLFIGGDI